jgi:hypothetical protein
VAVKDGALSFVFTGNPKPAPAPKAPAKAAAVGTSTTALAIPSSVKAVPPAPTPPGKKPVLN